MSKRPKLTSAQRALVTAFTALAGDAPDAAAFIAQAAEDAAPDELPELPGKALAALLADFWAFAATRKGEAPIIRLAPVEGAPALERLEIIQDDAPFLVDSVMGEIADQGLSVRAMFHPVVEVARDTAVLNGDDIQTLKMADHTSATSRACAMRLPASSIRLK